MGLRAEKPMEQKLLGIIHDRPLGAKGHEKAGHEALVLQL
jgi:hypothetical protein